MRALVLAAILLAGCAPAQQITTTRQVVVMPEEGMFSCERFSAWPDTARLTAVQVSRLIVEMYSTNERCYNSQQSLRRFLETARDRVSSQ